MAEEHKDYRRWTKEEQAADPYGYQVAIERARAEWEREQQQRKEQERREALQGELEKHLRQRGERYQDLTGEAPSRTLLERWRDEYADAREADREAERKAKFEQAYDF